MFSHKMVRTYTRPRDIKCKVNCRLLLHLETIIMCKGVCRQLIEFMTNRIFVYNYLKHFLNVEQKMSKVKSSYSSGAHATFGEDCHFIHFQHRV